ncbi:MAG: response regulator, partial [Dehalococcoidia bacterium]
MKKILIADDERSLRLLVGATLEGDKIQILEARDGAEALAMARSERPDLLLLDVQMPVMTGFEVCEQLKRDPGTRDIPTEVR